MPTFSLTQFYKDRRRAVIVAGASLLVLGVSLGGLTIATSSTVAADKTAEAAPQAIPVGVATVREENISAWEEFSGRLEAVDRVEIRPRVAGQIKSVHFREGALVRQGDLLFTIDPAPYAAEVARAKAQVAAAEARLTLTRSADTRAQRLLTDNAISRGEAESRQNDLQEAEANLAAAQAQLQSASLNLGYTQVRAPVSGRVGRIDVTQGNLVASGPASPMLTTLVSVSPIYASFDASEAVITRTLEALKTSGANLAFERVPVTLDTGESEPIEGKLQLIDNQFDSLSGTVRARAVFSNSEGRLIPGQFVRVRMGEASTRPAVLIHELAVGTDQDKRFVYVVGKDNTVEYREVRLGAAVNGLRIVTSGLKPGERIVVSGLQALRPGTLIAPQAVAMADIGKPQAHKG